MCFITYVPKNESFTCLYLLLFIIFGMILCIIGPSLLYILRTQMVSLNCCGSLVYYSLIETIVYLLNSIVLNKVYAVLTWFTCIISSPYNNELGFSHISPYLVQVGLIFV